MVTFLADLQKEPTKPVTIIEDNQSALSWLKICSSTVHLLSITSFRVQVRCEKVDLKYCRKVKIIIDFMKKVLSREQFEKLRLMAGMASTIEHPESSEKC